MSIHDRPAKNPGGMECEACGCIFIGEDWHSVCAVCLKAGAEIAVRDAKTSLGLPFAYRVTKKEVPNE